MYLVDDDPNQLLQASNHNAISATSDFLSVVSLGLADQYENFYFENLWAARDCVCINIYCHDPSLHEIVHMLVAKQCQSYDDQEAGSPSKQRDPESECFTHTTTSLKQNVFFPSRTAWANYS